MENYKKVSLHSAFENLVNSKFSKSDFDSIDDYWDFILALSDLAVDYGALNYQGERAVL